MPNLSISRAWEETTAFVAREARLLVPLALALLFLPGVITGLAAPRGQQDLNGSTLNMLLFFAEVLIGVIGQIAIARLALGHREPLGQVIGHAALRLPALLGSALIIILPLSLALFAAMGAAGAITTQGNSANPLAAMLLLLAMTILLVALIIIIARCLLNTAIAAVERGGPIQILKRGFAMTRGQVLRLIGALLLFAIGGGIAIVALTSVVGLGVTLTLGKPEPWTVAALLIALAGAAAQALLGTLFTICFARLYAQRAEGAAGVPSTAI
ncbi:MAG: hypothetical protein ABIO85_02130 [Sphingomicrobium sp.]